MHIIKKCPQVTKLWPQKRNGIRQYQKTGEVFQENKLALAIRFPWFAS